LRDKVLEVKELSFTYPDQTCALRGVSFAVHRGETLAVIGPNGAGKSTLLLHLNGVLRGRGRVEVLSEPISRKSLRQIRSKVGLVFQDPDDQLFMPTIFDDIAFGLVQQERPADEIQERVMRILRALGLEGLERRSAAHLSLGEKKKAALAAVLVLEPEILVLDEPASGLDPGTRRALIKLLSEITVTKIIATHDLDLVAEIASRLILMDTGQVVAEGNPEAILGNQDLLEGHRLEVPLSVVLRKALKNILL
jgi:cobalt/nickel transport system ATP-binding protein